MTKRWFWVGARDGVAAPVAAALGQPAATSDARSAAAGDLVVIDIGVGGSALGSFGVGHVFGAVRAWRRAGASVFVALAEDDATGIEIARFCLADGVLRIAPDGRVDVSALSPTPAARRPATAGLLERLEAKVEASGQGESVRQRLLRYEREDSLLHRLQDPETGLFDGAYATLKLDEEWKRAMRFHQPLSLLLLELGPGLLGLGESERRALLAEASGVFLNECRDIDVLARFSPTVFLFLMPGTGTAGARVLGERILAALRERLPDDPSLRPVGGLATVPATEIADRRAFLMVAEACLRDARATGESVLRAAWQ